MTRAGRFRAAVAMRAHGQGPDLGVELPNLLAQACADVTSASGASLGFLVRADDGALGVPLGASDAMAARVEQLEMTLGEGPCLSAAAGQRTVAVDAAMMTRRWPIFTSELAQWSPVRSITSILIPELLGDDGMTATLTMYLTAPEPANPDQLFGGEADDVLAVIGDMLFNDPAWVDHDGTLVPAWLTSSSVERRVEVWVALGMVSEHAGVPATAALALLRSHAYAHQLTLDDLAEQITGRRLGPGALAAL